MCLEEMEMYDQFDNLIVQRLKGIEAYIKSHIIECEEPQSQNYVIDGECICINKRNV